VAQSYKQALRRYQAGIRKAPPMPRKPDDIGLRART